MNPNASEDMSGQHNGIPAEEAFRRLKEGNRRYSDSGPYCGDVSPARRIVTADEGQHPYAAIVTCSDSRVIPEVIFSAGIGELFVIRSAGNTVDGCTLGSIEYAVGHMGVNLVVVMGHIQCGAIAEALNGFHEGHSIEIINDIRCGIGDKYDVQEATARNVRYSVRKIEEDIDYSSDAKVIGAIYDIRTGKVDFLD